MIAVANKELKEKGTIKRILTPIKAIRAKCVDCMGGEVRRVPDCDIPEE